MPELADAWFGLLIPTTAKEVIARYSFWEDIDSEAQTKDELLTITKIALGNIVGGVIGPKTHDLIKSILNNVVNQFETAHPDLEVYLDYKIQDQGIHVGASIKTPSFLSIRTQIRQRVISLGIMARLPQSVQDEIRRIWGYTASFDGIDRAVVIDRGVF